MATGIDLNGPMERACQKIEKAIVKKILSGVPPPNAPSTIKRKKSSKTLVDTGDMYRHVTYQIHGEGLEIYGEIGIFVEELANRLYWNEYGTRTGIPARPSFWPAFDETAPKAAEEMAEEVFKQVADYLGW